MSKYYVEQYHHYYPRGGMNDFAGPFDSLEEAQRNVTYSHFYDFVAILRVEDNVLQPVAWWDNAKWEYAEGVDSPYVHSTS